MLFRTALLAVPLLMAPLANSAGIAGDFSIRGAGLLACENYLEERADQSPAYLMIGGWMDGYITGINQYAPETYDLTTFESTELIAKVVEAHCQKNPKDRLFTVMNSIAMQLREERIRDNSPVVSVKVGKLEVGLYKVVIQRAQQKLTTLNMYNGEISGKFDELTQKAIADYQTSVKFTPTGFPDQATLWKLLRS